MISSNAETDSKPIIIIAGIGLFQSQIICLVSNYRLKLQRLGKPAFAREHFV